MGRRKKRNNIPVILMALGGLLLLSAGIILVVQRSPKSTPTAEAPIQAEDTYPDIQRVKLEEAKTAFDEGTAVFVDVRGPAAYKAGRVPGAVLIPLNDLETRWKELNPNDWIITYCT